MGLVDDADDPEWDIGDGDRRADRELVGRRVAGVNDRHVSLGVRRAEGSAGAELGRGERAEPEVEQSTPSTMKLVAWIAVAGGAPFLLSWDSEGIVLLESIADSPPATAFTPRRRAIDATDEAGSTLSPSVSVRLSTCWTVLPRLDRVLARPGVGFGYRRRVERRRRLGHRDVGADAVERVQHRRLGVAHPSGRRGHRDDQAHPNGQAHRHNQSLAFAALQLPEQVGEEEAAVTSARPAVGADDVPGVFPLSTRKLLRLCWPIGWRLPAVHGRVTGPDETHPGGASDLHGPFSAA